MFKKILKKKKCFVQFYGNPALGLVLIASGFEIFLGRKITFLK